MATLTSAQRDYLRSRGWTDANIATLTDAQKAQLSAAFANRQSNPWALSDWERTIQNTPGTQQQMYYPTQPYAGAQTWANQNFPPATAPQGTGAPPAGPQPPTGRDPASVTQNATGGDGNWVGPGGTNPGGSGASGQGTDVYGGIDWKRLEMEAMIETARQAYQYWVAQGADAATARNYALQAAQQRMNSDLAAGYVRQGGYTANMGGGGYNLPGGMSGYTNPTPGGGASGGAGGGAASNANVVVRDTPGRADALEAIYNNRGDIKGFYDANPDWANKTVQQRMENWLGMTDEAAYAGKTDTELIQAAKSSGWLMTTAEQTEAANRATYPTVPGANPWQPQFYDENNPPSERDALWSIWQNDYRIQQQYAARFPNNWQGAMEQWKTDNNVRSAADYAVNNGYLQVLGAREKTLERESAEHGWEDTDLDRALRERAQTETEQYNQNQFVMQYLNNLSAKKGPENWIEYWKYQRGVNDGTQVPTWLTAAQQNYNLPSWGINYGQGQQAQPAGQAQAAPDQIGGWGGGTPQYAGVPAAATGQQQGQQPVGANAQGGYSNEAIQGWQNALSGLQPWQMSQQQWSGMLPSEQQALLGGIDSSGGYGQDWEEQMRRAMPRGTTSPYTSWR